MINEIFITILLLTVIKPLNSISCCVLLVVRLRLQCTIFWCLFCIFWCYCGSSFRFFNLLYCMIFEKLQALYSVNVEFHFSSQIVTQSSVFLSLWLLANICFGYYSIMIVGLWNVRGVLKKNSLPEIEDFCSSNHISVFMVCEIKSKGPPS